MARSGRRGRSPGITPELIDQIATYVEAGAYPETAGAACGVPVKTLQSWLTRGGKECRRLDKDNRAKLRKDEQLYVELRERITVALSKGEIRDLEIIRMAAKRGVWQAAAWRLERRWPKRYAKNVVVQREDELQERAPMTWRQLAKAAEANERAEAKATKYAGTQGRTPPRNVG